MSESCSPNRSCTQKETEGPPSPNHSMEESTATFDEPPSSNYSENKESESNAPPHKKPNPAEVDMRESSPNMSGSHSSVGTQNETEGTSNPNHTMQESTATLNESPSSNCSIKEEPENYDQLFMSARRRKIATNMIIVYGLPPDWKKPQVVELINDPDIVESILDMTFKTGDIEINCCHITFTTSEMAINAKKVMLQNIIPKYPDKEIIVEVVRKDPEADIIGFPVADNQRSRSRSPLLKMDTKNMILKIKSQEKNSKVLQMRNVPRYWNKAHIEQYIMKYTSSNTMIVPNIRYIYIDKLFGKSTGLILVSFTNAEACIAAKLMLTKAPEISEGEKIWVDFEKLNSKTCVWAPNGKPDYAKMKIREKEKKLEHFGKQMNQTNNNKVWHNKNFNINPGNFNFRPPAPIQKPVRIFQNDVMPTNDSPHNTYGLSKEFLTLHGIAPPLYSKIFVGNLDEKYGSEVKIRELFGHAGLILSVFIIGKKDGTMKVKVEYDHPVEAVQAVCMFNKQVVHNKVLVVNIDSSPNAKKRFLPDGLMAFGPGLGPNGLPLKGVRSHIEIQNMKNMIMKEIAKIRPENNHQGNNSSVYSDSQTMTSQPETSEMNVPVEADPTTAFNTALVNPAQNNQLSALSSILIPAVQMLQGLTQSFAGNNPAVAMPTAQGQSFNNQDVLAASTSGWNVQTTDVTQNMLAGYMNMYSGSDMSGANMQSAQMNQGGLPMQGGLNMQAGPNMQSGYNMQTGSVMQGGANIQNNPFNQGGYPMQGGPNLQAGPNMQSGFNIQNASIMQGGANMQNAPINQGGLPVQGGLPMQGGLNVQAGSSLQGGFNMPGITNTQDGSNMPTGSNVHSVSSQSAKLSAPVKNNKTYGGAPSKNSKNSENIYHDHSERQHKSDNDASASVLLNYLPPSVTLSALKIKMHEVGDVKMAEMTGPGRAVVVFYSSRDAKACVKLLDQTRVDGQTIDVRFL